MFDIGTKVVVITEKGISYDAVILAVAKDDSGHAAYKVALDTLGHEQFGQWHKAGDVFLQEQHTEAEEASWDNFIKPS
jgi:hypothetical protein